MSKYLSLLVLSFFQIMTTAQSRKQFSKEELRALSIKIDSILILDQKYRPQLSVCEFNAQKLDSLLSLPLHVQTEHSKKVKNSSYPCDQDKLDSLWNRQQLIDSLNSIELEKIIRKYGYPGKKLIGEHKADILLRHVPISWEEKMYPILLEQYKKGNIRGITVANMRDRYLKFRGEPPLYYTELILTAKGKIKKQSPPRNRLEEVNKALEKSLD